MKTLKFVGLMLFLGATLAHAKVTVNEDFKGTIMITTPDGKVLMIDAGMPVPEIPNQSTIEVFQGEATIKTQPGDSVGGGCVGQTGSVGGSVSAKCGESEGTIKVDEGTFVVDDKTYQKGDEVKVTVGSKTADKNQEAAPTAAGTETGSTANLNISPVDNRSITLSNTLQSTTTATLSNEASPAE